MAFDNEIDKINKTELSDGLVKLIDDAYAHMANQAIHISQEERNSWNKASNTVIGKATILENGLMSKEDKLKLDSIESGANNYIHPKYAQVPSGTYLSVSTDNTGHVIYGDNPRFLDCTVDNAIKLKNTIYGEFARKVDQTFGDNITINPNKDTYDGTPVTFKNFNDYKVSKAVVKGNSISTDDDTKFAADGSVKSLYVDPSTKNAYLYRRSGSALSMYQLVSAENVVRIDSRTRKIPKRYINDDGVPIGTMFYWLGSNIPDGYLPMNGMYVPKSSVPELIEYASNNGLLEVWNNMMEGKIYNSKFVLKDNNLIMPTFNRAIAVSSNNAPTNGGNVSEWITKSIFAVIQVGSGLWYRPKPNEFNTKQDTNEIQAKDSDSYRYVAATGSYEIGQTYLTMYDSGAAVATGDDMAPNMITVNYIIKASTSGLKIATAKQLNWDYYNIDNGSQVRFSDVLDHIKCNNHRPLVDVTISNQDLAFSTSAEIGGIYNKLRYERLNPYRQLIIRNLGKSIYYPYSVDLNENNLITIAENKVPDSTFTIQVSKADQYDKMEKFDSLKTRLASYGVTLVKV